MAFMLSILTCKYLTIFNYTYSVQITSRYVKQFSVVTISSMAFVLSKFWSDLMNYSIPILIILWDDVGWGWTLFVNRSFNFHLLTIRHLTVQPFGDYFHHALDIVRSKNSSTSVYFHYCTMCHISPFWMDSLF